MITAPGLYPELSETYQNGRGKHTPTQALTQSGIKVLLNETPYDFRNPSPRKSDEMDFGSIVHALALGKGAKFVVAPFDDYRTKAAQTWRDEQIEEGLIPIKQAKFDDAESIAGIIRAKLHRLFKGKPYQTEVPFFWLEGETWCGGMADAWCESELLIADPKVTMRIGQMARSQMINFGWDMQAAWTLRGFNAIFPQHAGRIRFANILIKPAQPFTSRVVALNESWRHSAERECERALRIFQHCMKYNEWPGYPDGIEALDEPAWAMNARMMAGVMEEGE